MQPVISRISGLFAAIFCLALPLLAASPVIANETAQHNIKRHGISLFGDPALAKGFAHFPYVNPQAPKGGALTIASIGTFDSLNRFSIKGNPAEGLGLVHDALMTPSLDEPSAAYGLIAETVSHPADYSSVTFTLRKTARFSDNSPITANDVAFSLDALRDAHPFYRAYYGDVEKTEILSPHKIRFIFSQTGNRELPLILGQLPVLSKAWWSAEGRGLDKTTLDVPVTSGAYRIAALEPGRSITYQRLADYWARDLNVNIGKHNFDTIKYLSFGDDTVAFEALKAGDVHFRREYSSRVWATGYDLPSVEKGQLQRETVALENSHGMQAFVMNTRRAPFNNIYVREALNWAYDFEWTNKNLFYGQYARTGSFFENSELAATGKPSKAELELLLPLSDQLPPAVFDTPPANPVTDGSGNIRGHLRKARALLQKAGWTIEKGKLQKNGTPMKIEFLLVQPAFERIVGAYIRNLEKLGIDAHMRTIDPTQYQNRLTNYDFDISVYSFRQSLSPGNEQRDFWTSAAADRPGGRNLIGIKNKAVDILVEKLIFAPSRDRLVAASRALDRVLRANHYVVPQWHAPHERLAYWQGIAHGARLPKYGLGFPSVWYRTAPHKGVQP
jgi:microcin C transport system substrate-binding protein